MSFNHTGLVQLFRPLAGGATLTEAMPLDVWFCLAVASGIFPGVIQATTPAVGDQGKLWLKPAADPTAGPGAVWVYKASTSAWVLAASNLGVVWSKLIALSDTGGAAFANRNAKVSVSTPMLTGAYIALTPWTTVLNDTPSSTVGTSGLTVGAGDAGNYIASVGVTVPVVQSILGVGITVNGTIIRSTVKRGTAYDNQICEPIILSAGDVVSAVAYLSDATTVTASMTISRH